MRHRFIITILFFLFTACFAHAQQFGGNPSGTKWQQINTDTVRVIFPKGFDQKAQRIAAIVHQLQKKYSQTIGDSIRKVNIVLQNQTLVSNAYVALGPYRSEFYTTPPQHAFELGGVSWTDNLAVHEFRHVQQYSNFRKGLSKFASFILGEEGQAIANAAAVPDWFFEGDAVFNETKLTRQGRGTLPLFFSSYQSLYNSGRHYSYMKMRNGSLRHYVPNHYDLGYLLVAYGRKQYGDDIWRKVTDDAVRFQPLFYPFQGAVKKNTGLSFSRYVQNAMEFYEQQWKPAKGQEPEWLSKPVKNNVVNYKYPYPAADGSFIVLKNSYSSIPAFYKILPDNKEVKIAVRDIAVDDYFSYNNGKIVYAAFRPDARWGNRDYNVIKILDTESGEEKQVTGPGRFFSPDISHDAKLIAAVIPAADTSQLVILQTADGKMIRTEKGKDMVYSYPKFSADDALLYWVARNAKGEMAIYKAGVEGGNMEPVLPFSNRIIGFLQVQHDTLLFSTTYKGRDELWGLIDNKRQKSPYRLASYATGLYQGVLRGNKVISAAFTADGYRLASFNALWEPVALKDAMTDLYVPEVYRQQDHLALDSLPVRQYAVGKYPKSFHLLNIHSWRPYYDYPEYSFTLYGENVLNTFHSEIAYRYNQNESSHQLGYNGIYGGSYLQPLFGIHNTWQRSALWNKDTTLNWNELVAYAGLRLPLNLSGGRQYRNLGLQATVNTEQVRWTGVGQKLLKDATFNYLEASVQYSGQVQQAVQHIYPKWGQSLFVQYRSIINKYTAHQLLVKGSLYLPGLASSHSLVLTGAVQVRDTMRQYFFTNNFPFSRGYQVIDFPRSWKLGANYHFTVWYPDWGFANMVYFRRIRANAFYDYTLGKSLRTGREFSFGTVGGELYFDTRWWNQQPVTFGLRYSHLIDRQFLGTTKPSVWELILPVTLFK